MTDDKWVLVAPSIPPANPGDNKRTVDLRDVMTGAIY
jgi:transposase